MNKKYENINHYTSYVADRRISYYTCMNNIYICNAGYILGDKFKHTILLDNLPYINCFSYVPRKFKKNE